MEHTEERPRLNPCACGYANIGVFKTPYVQVTSTCMMDGTYHVFCPQCGNHLSIHASREDIATTVWNTLRKYSREVNDNEDNILL